jgi:hypothetical protein
MEEYQERVIKEKRELDLKIVKLEEFFWGNPAWFDVVKDERLRLVKQYGHMCDYSRVLGERIANFKEWTLDQMKK